ncbi:MAG: hypothetical protein E7K68_04265, partial [Corynebacterium kroppenstedtii]|nr:hypothetical protein [Corynebacterium kroppenstedtii]
WAGHELPLGGDYLPENIEKGASDILLYLYLCRSKALSTVVQTCVRRERTWSHEAQNRTIGGTPAQTHRDGGCGVSRRWLK